MRATLTELDAMARRRTDGGVIVGGEGERLADLVAVEEVCAEVKRLALSDLARAMTLSELLVLLASEDDPDGHHVWSARAHVLCYSGRLDEAIDCLSRARASATAHGSSRDVGLVELASVQALARGGRLPEALTSADLAAALLEESGDAVGCGKAHLNAGIVLRMMGRPREALDRFALSLPPLCNDDLTCGAVLSNRAEALLDLDRFEEAASAFKEALERFSRGGHSHAAAIVEGNLADLLSRQGRLDEAISAFEHARRLYESCGAKADAARLAAEQAEAYEAAGSWDAAIRAYGEALKALDEASLKREAARACAGLGRALHAAGAACEGSTALRRAMDEFGAIGAMDLAAECGALLIASRVRSREDVLADELDPRGLEDRPARRARARAEIAEALLDVGRVDDAERLVALLWESEASWSNRPLLARVEHLRGRVRLARGETRAAADVLCRAVTLAESVRGTLRADGLRSSWGESRRAVYQDCATACLSVGGAWGLERAFEAIERLRRRSRLATMAQRVGGADDGRDGLAASLSRELVALTQELNVRYSELSGAHRGNTDSATLRESISDLETRAQRVRDRLGAIGSEASGFADVMPLERVQSAMDEGMVGLTLFREGAAISAMLVSRASVRVVRGFVGESDARAALRRVRFCVERVLGGGDARDESGFALSMKRLGALVLAPIATYIAGHGRMVINAPTWLSEVPWSALPFDGGALVDRVTVSHSWGLSSLFDGSSFEAVDGPVLAVGVSDELAPAMEEEARAVAEISRGAVVLTGSAATASAVLTALSTCRSAHLATHFLHSPTFPLSSRVRLHDRWVTAREIAAVVRPGCSLTLASCESGRTGAADEEGSHGLVGVLLDAGVHVVAASRWRLRDDVALAMFPRAHQRRELGLAEAMAGAQRDLRSSGCPSWAWGGVFVTGGLMR